MVDTTGKIFSNYTAEKDFLAKMENKLITNETWNNQIVIQTNEKDITVITIDSNH